MSFLIFFCLRNTEQFWLTKRSPSHLNFVVFVFLSLLSCSCNKLNTYILFYSILTLIVHLLDSWLGGKKKVRASLCSSVGFCHVDDFAVEFLKEIFHHKYPHSEVNIFLLRYILVCHVSVGEIKVWISGGMLSLHHVHTLTQTKLTSLYPSVIVSRAGVCWQVILNSEYLSLCNRM